MSSLALVIRTQDHADCLAETLRRLHDQVDADRLVQEIVHIDMGSTDGSLGILRLYQPDKLAQLQPELFSDGAALNLAMRMTKASWVIFLDGDIWLNEATCLKNLAGDLTLNQNQAAVVSRQTRRSGLHDVFAHDQFQRFGHGNASGSMLQGGQQGLAGVAISRAAWEVQPFREDLRGCDVEEWASRVERLGWRVEMSPSATVVCGRNFTPREVYEQARLEALSWSRVGDAQQQPCHWRGRPLHALGRACLSDLKFSFEKGNVLDWPYSAVIQAARLLGERRGYAEAQRAVPKSQTSAIGGAAVLP